MGSLKLNTPDEYVRKYISEAHLLDMFYRKSLENYHQLSDSTPIISAIEKVKKQLDIDYANCVISLIWNGLPAYRRKAAVLTQSA